MSFWLELRRRYDSKVCFTYAIIALLIIQAMAISFWTQRLQSWTLTFFITLLITGFTPTLLFAWPFETAPKGIKLTKEALLVETITLLTRKKPNYILTGK